MKINDNARLSLMLEEITNIESFMMGVDSYEAFESNKILCHAVIYNMQCIGENVYRLSQEFLSQHSSIDWEAIEGLRHVLVHDYYQVSMSMIWSIIKDDLPALKEYLATIH